jgi:hypothetical protein
MLDSTAIPFSCPTLNYSVTPPNRLRSYGADPSQIDCVAEHSDTGYDVSAFQGEGIRKAGGRFTPVNPLSFRNFAAKYPNLRRPIIDGLLREGETANIIAASKTGKSFFAHGLALHVATGATWLSRKVEKGRVLIIDNELHPETLTDRLKTIANALSLKVDGFDSCIDFACLRGENVDITQLGNKISKIKPGDYKLVILDALYRAIPEGSSENDNAQMMKVYNHLDFYAASWGCGIVVIHHASKGVQSDKAIIDVGAGAGAISRAADTHITIRQHEEDSLCVLEAVTRSFKSPNPVSIEFKFPLWQASSVPPVICSPKKAQKDRERKAKEHEDQSSMEALFEMIPAKGRIQQDVLLLGFSGGVSRMKRLAGILFREGKITIKKETMPDSNRKGVFYYRAKAAGASGPKRTPRKPAVPANKTKPRPAASGKSRTPKKANSNSDSTRKTGIS